MNILHVLPQLGMGGVERGVIELALGAQQHGHQVWVTSRSKANKPSLAAANIKHITGPWHHKNPFTWKQRAKQLAQLVKQHQIDLIHAHSRIPCWLAHLSRKYHTAALVTGCYSNHGLGPLGLKKIYNQSMLKGDATITTSQFLQTYLSRHYNCTNTKIHRIARGADSKAWQAKPDDVANLRKQWTIDHRPVVLFPARISRKKGQHLLLEALSYLPAHTALHVIFIGKHQDATYLQALQDAIANAPAQHRIQCLPGCDDLASAYRLADVIVNAAMQAEPFGRIPLEAGLAKRLVIVPRAGGFLETVLDQETGYVYDVGSSRDLAAKLKQVLGLGPAQKAKLEDQAYQHIKQHFGLDQMIEKTMAVYASITKT